MKNIIMMTDIVVISKGIDCVINNNNTNTNINLGGGNQTIPSEPPTGSLTVKKEIFRCDNIRDRDIFEEMDCSLLQPNSSGWLSCDNSTISNTIYCQTLQESFFDIEVLDYQNNPIQEFQGSQQGTIINPESRTWYIYSK